ncbi:B-block binding subunit of TFIIIC domain-containing protein [Dioscorea alata]|uniref:B-block binding subunit of TFIIIC domain-containing protein n=1 Tax=Dioscorea alata TaxID=55571 RepID=A0ACB7TZI6_DIOAL|nr:B-block binding subunit of TFIIIC domain-containing protein [Dioscorea alata]
MDSILASTLEEVCIRCSAGIPLSDLWPALQASLSSAGLPLCDAVKTALWSRLLFHPALRFEASDGSFLVPSDDFLRSFDEAERLGLKIVAEEHLRENFLGIYDLKAADGELSAEKKRVLERLALARTSGLTQNDLAKEFGMKGNNIFYLVRGLECHKLITRQSTLLKMKESGIDGELGSKCTQIVHTNLIHLCRYAKHANLGSQQRIEISRPDMLANPCNLDATSLTENNASGEYLEDVHIEDFLPAMKLICDKLEGADEKVLVASDIKQVLGYRLKKGHRAWRNILNRLKDAGFVEEFLAKINGKISRRVGLSGKLALSRVADMCSRYRMNMTAELNKRTKQYRVWTSRNYQSSEAFQNKCVETTDRSEYLNPSNELSSHGQLSWITKTPDCCENDLSPTDKGPMISEMPLLCSAERDNSQVAVFDKDNQKQLNLEILDGNHFVENGITECAPNSKTDLHEKLLSTSAPAKLQTSQTYPCIASTVSGVQREQRILERLKNEKFLLTVELHKWLEGLEKDKTTSMDRKTLTRTLNKLQAEGLCKCARVIIPVVTNCNQSRKTEVILHPSIGNLSKELLDQIHKKQRTFNTMVRSRASVSSSKNEPATVLNSVKRLSSHLRRDNNAQLKSENMLANGFVPAKMIRAKLLHCFLWGYLTMQDNFDSRKYDYGLNGSVDTCQLFALDAAVKAMPLELFLQVVGSAKQFDNLVMNCKLGMRLSDLTPQEYKQLMDTNATGRLSCLIDILRRLKLLQLVPEQAEEDDKMLPHAVLTHALELKPYVEEPFPKSLSSSNSCAFDLHLKLRHEFVLTKQDTVDSYWETLEYCYATADPESAKHAFPGSTVPEVFSSRSWASVRVMTVEQRVELFKCMAHDNPQKKIPFNECIKIAKELNLTLEQVLRVSYDKRLSHLNKYQRRTKRKVQGNFEDENSSEQNARKRKQNSVDGSCGQTRSDDDARESSLSIDPGVSVDVTQTITADSVVYNSSENIEFCPGRYNDDGMVAAAKETEHNENTANCNFIGECAFSRFKPMRRKKFAWTDNTDRLLIMQYARQRAILGARSHRVDWNSISGLPALPVTCRRRMAMMRTDANVRKAMMRVCNILGERYARYLNEKHKNHDSAFPCDLDTERRISDVNLGGSVRQNMTSTTENAFVSNVKGYHWDDFEDLDVKAAIEEVLQCKKMIKMEHVKRLGSTHEKEWANVLLMDGTQIDSTMSSQPGEATQNLVEEQGKSRTAVSSSGRNKSNPHHSHGRFLKLYGSRDINLKSQVCKSLSVSNAVELLKMVFLNTSAAPEVQASLSETLRLYSESDIFVAFDYLKMKNYMAIGHGNQPFVLSQKFWHNASSSPFPVDSGKRAAKFLSWLDEEEKDLFQDGAFLSPHIQCGECLQLFALVSSGRLSVAPCLPNEGIGEPEEINSTKSSIPIEDIGRHADQRNLKRKRENGKLGTGEVVKKPKPLYTKDKDFCNRREKGFPGIKVALNHGTIFSIDPVQSLKCNGALDCSLPCNAKSQIGPSPIEDAVSSPPLNCNSYPHHNIGSNIQLTLPSKYDLLATMTSYAMQLSLKLDGENEASKISPEVFQCVLSAISQAGEQGLSMEELAKVTGLHGKLLAELVVGTLEVYRVAFKVNAYDSVRFVDFSYRTKYYLNAFSDHSEASYLSSYVKSLVTSYEVSKHQSQENHNVIKTIENSVSLDLCDGHKIAIVDSPQKVDQLGTGFDTSEAVHDTTDIDMQLEADCAKENRVEDNDATATGGSCVSRPIVPWINGDGSVNTIVYKALSRRVLGLVMQNPGIIEDDIISRMDVLNPQVSFRIPWKCYYSLLFVLETYNLKRKNDEYNMFKLLISDLM